MPHMRLPQGSLAIARVTTRQVGDALGRARAEQTRRWIDLHAELDAKRAHYTSLFLDAPVPYFTFDHRGTIVDVNQAAADLLGTTPQGSAGKPFVALVHPPDARLFQRHLVNCRRDGGARVALRLRREGGDPRPVELVTRGPDRDMNRPISRTIILDVEAARKRDCAVARSEKRHREIIETASDGISIVDTRNRIVFVNRRFAAMVGIPAEDLVGRSAYDFVPEEERRQAHDDFSKRDIVAESRETRLRRADGSLLRTSVSGSLMRNDRGRFTGLLRMYTDTTAQHDLLEARQSLVRELINAQERERERLARELHDQLGQHIVALGLGLAKLATITSGPEEAPPVVAQLRGIVEQLGRDVHSLAFELRPAALDHLGLAVALTSYCEDAATRSGVEIDLHCGDLTTLHLSGTTETAVYRAAQEGVTNALKHARATRVSVVVERRGDALLIIVEDNGVGLETTAATAATAGLGLRGMRERVVLLGGTVSIESSREHGTTLYARIPLDARSLNGPHEQTAASAR